MNDGVKAVATKQPKVLWSDGEIESSRQEHLQELSDDPVEQDVPGSFGCHELLDRTSVVMDNLERFVLSHSACVRNERWFSLAHKAFESLFELYQDIGATHLGAPTTASWHKPKTMTLNPEP